MDEPRSNLPNPAHPGLNVLYAEDSDSLLQLISTVLTRDGYQVETALNGAAAWKTIQSRSFDLLITDHQMPYLSGLELIQKVRQARMKIPVLLASACIDEIPVSVLAGLDCRVLPKPFSVDELVATVDEILQPEKILHESDGAQALLQSPKQKPDASRQPTGRNRTVTG